MRMTVKVRELNEVFNYFQKGEYRRVVAGFNEDFIMPAVERRETTVEMEDQRYYAFRQLQNMMWHEIAEEKTSVQTQKQS